MSRNLFTKIIVASILMSSCGGAEGDGKLSTLLSNCSGSLGRRSSCDFFYDDPLQKEVLQNFEYNDGRFSLGQVVWDGQLIFTDEPYAPLGIALVTYDPSNEYPFTIDRIEISSILTFEEQRSIFYKELYAHAKTWNYLYNMHPELFGDGATHYQVMEFADMLSHLMVPDEQLVILGCPEDEAVRIPNWDGESPLNKEQLDYLSRWNSSHPHSHPDYPDIQPIIDIFRGDIMEDTTKSVIIKVVNRAIKKDWEQRQVALFS